jgi:hypothetical protein
MDATMRDASSDRASTNTATATGRPDLDARWRNSGISHHAVLQATIETEDQTRPMSPAGP